MVVVVLLVANGTMRVGLSSCAQSPTGDPCSEPVPAPPLSYQLAISPDNVLSCLIA